MVITSEPDVKPSGESSVGSSQMLKLFEISKVFEGEAKLLKIVYISKVHCGLSCSIQNETHGRHSVTKTLERLISLGKVVANRARNRSIFRMIDQEILSTPGRLSSPWKLCHVRFRLKGTIHHSQNE